MIEDILNLRPGAIRIVDVGAAFLGEVPPYQPLLDRGLGQIITFEPDARQHEALTERLGPSGRVLPYALGDGRPHTLHICGPKSGMTSLLEPDPRSLGFFNLFATFGQVFATERITTLRLDDCAEIVDIDYLKMDVQGSELMILQNGRAKLTSCVFIQTEISFVPLYKNQPGFGEIDQELRMTGFVPHRFTALKRWSILPTVRNDDPRQAFNQLLEGDIVYMRDLIFGRPDDEALRKTAVIAHYCYDSPDLAMRCILELQRSGAVPPDAGARYIATLQAKPA